MLSQKNVARSRQEPKAQSNPAQGRNACQAVTPLLTEGDIRAPEVWCGLTSTIGVPLPSGCPTAQVLDGRGCNAGASLLLLPI